MIKCIFPLSTLQIIGNGSNINPLVLQNSNLMIFTQRNTYYYTKDVEFLKTNKSNMQVNIMSSFIDVNSSYLMLSRDLNSANAIIVLFNDTNYIEQVTYQNRVGPYQFSLMRNTLNQTIMVGFTSEYLVVRNVYVDSYIDYARYGVFKTISNSHFFDCIETNTNYYICGFFANSSLSYYTNYKIVMNNANDYQYEYYYQYIYSINTLNYLKVLKVSEEDKNITVLFGLQDETRLLFIVGYFFPVRYFFLVNKIKSNNSKYLLTNLTCTHIFGYVDYMLLNDNTVLSACGNFNFIEIGFHNFLLDNGTITTYRFFSLDQQVSINSLRFNLFEHRPTIFSSLGSDSYFELLFAPSCETFAVKELYINEDSEIFAVKDHIVKARGDSSIDELLMIFPVLPSLGYIKLSSTGTTVKPNVNYQFDSLIYHSGDGEGTFTLKFAGYSSEGGVGQYCSISFTVNLCYETCFRCNGVNDNNCLTCREGYYNLKGLSGYCFNTTTKPINTYFDQENEVYDYCYNDCATCNEKGDITDMKCTSCINNFYNAEDKVTNCYQNPDGYYLDTIIYRKCYKTCKTCSQGGNDSSHNCDSCPSNTYQNGTNCYPLCLDTECIFEGECISDYAHLVKQGKYCFSCKPDYKINGASSCTSSQPTEGYQLINPDYNYYEECSYNWYISDSGEYKCSPNDNCEGITDRTLLEETNKQCVKSCMDDATSYCKECLNSFLYAYKGKCISSCPSGTKKNDTIHRCISDIEEIEKCIGDTCEDKATELLKNTITDYVNQSTTVNGDGFIAQMYPEDNPSFTEEESKKTSTVDLSECIAILRKNNFISADESVIVIKMDIYIPGKTTPQVEYSLYATNGTKLDLSLCNDVPINISYPISPTLNTTIAKEYASKGIDIYNAESDFFNDICVPYSEDGKDVSLSDRREYIYQNVSFCDTGCTYLGINYTTNKVNCECNIKNTLDTERVEEEELMNNNIFSKELFSVNINVMKCYKLFKIKNLYNNIGFLLTITAFMSQIVFMIVCYSYEIVKWYSKLNFYTNSAPSSKTDNNNVRLSKRFTLDSVDVFLFQPKEQQNQSICHTKSLLMKSTMNESISLEKEKPSFELNEKKLIINDLSIQDQKMFFIRKKDIDNYPYSLAQKEDQRNYLYMFIKTFREKQLLLRSIFIKSQFELITMNISLFLSHLSMYFTLNALFYTDTLISSRYKGELTFIQNILRSIYSCLVSTVIFTILSFATSFAPLLDMLIVEVKYKKPLCRLTNHAEKVIKRKILIFFIVEIVIMLVFIYYISCFCIVYHSTQVSWFLGGLTSFGLSLLVCLGFCVSISLFRYIGIKCNSPCIYNFALLIKSLY